ncbi:hypothetical protein OUZ56_007218 [Daphnia magna]|uniref:Uncharacterized protein n=1 Tax=Daphnia magna TaxID=35525 RepID=A0ABQ9YY12_9CRUS|nr:hypothetical protein OUZ56_007218 [Daphnia magna]
MTLQLSEQKYSSVVVRIIMDHLLAELIMGLNATQLKEVFMLRIMLKNIGAECPSKVVMFSYQSKAHVGYPILASWKSEFPFCFNKA